MSLLGIVIVDITHNQRYNIRRHDSSRGYRAGKQVIFMCGRYYMDDDTAREIEKLVRQVDEKMRKAENIHLQTGDIHPSELAPVVAVDDNKMWCRWQRWGFLGFSGKQLIINAQCESALEKKCSGKVWSIGGSWF